MIRWKHLLFRYKSFLHNLLIHCIADTIMIADTYKNDNESLTMDNLNPQIMGVSDAVRGPTVLRAAEIEEQLNKVTC